MTYAPLTISAVNHTAGTLTITGHGLITGGGFSASPRGPLYGGALFAPAGGVIPTGLAPVTTYWPIVVDADTIKLASSNANAMAGTAVTFSTDGTLPLRFLVGLPYELPRISAPMTQKFSDDDNTTWQALKALWALLTGQPENVWGGNVTLAGALVADDVSASGEMHGQTVIADISVEAPDYHWSTASVRPISAIRAQPQFPATPAATRVTNDWTFQPAGAELVEAPNPDP